MKTLKTKLVLIDEQVEPIMKVDKPEKKSIKTNQNSWVWGLVGLVVVIIIIYLINKSSKS